MSDKEFFVQQVSIVWFRNDLRLADNPALNAALTSGHAVLPVYIYPDGQRLPGAASKWWLDKSLRSLDADLETLGGRLHVLDASDTSVKEAFSLLMKDYDVQSVFWNRRYEPTGRATDEDLKKWFSGLEIEAKSFNGNLLIEPWKLKTKTGEPYKVFTPFWRALQSSYSDHPTNRPETGHFVSDAGVSIDALGLHPSKPDWSGGIADAWTPGETAASETLQNFLEGQLQGYKDKRDRPDLPATSGLSPYLAFGEISPRQIWATTETFIGSKPELENDGWAFLREIAWRDFSYSLLFQSKDLSKHNWNDRFDAFPWTSNDAAELCWQKGLTGYPIVDAGMRQLWETGWMHNRVRMIVASFLIKHLRINWRRGEDWFWDTLVDADAANNPASWQWVAGSGADAAPYFRIFNPITQAEKFDPKGDYIKQWVPELTDLPVKYLSAPWTAPELILKSAGIKLGETYPKPIVDHSKAREAALAAYEDTKQRELS